MNSPAGLSSNNSSSSDIMSMDEPAVVSMNSDTYERATRDQEETATETDEIRNDIALASFQSFLVPTEHGTEFPQHNGKLLIGDELLYYITSQYDIKSVKEASTEQIRESANDVEFLASLRMKYAAAKCTAPHTGNYWRIWRKFKQWQLKTYPQAPVFFSPCSGKTVFDSAPWMTFERGAEFATNQLKDSRIMETGKYHGSFVCACVSAINYLIRHQHAMAKYVLRGSCPVLRQLSQSDLVERLNAMNITQVPDFVRTGATKNGTRSPVIVTPRHSSSTLSTSDNATTCIKRITPSPPPRPNAICEHILTDNSDGDDFVTLNTDAALPSYALTISSEGSFSESEEDSIECFVNSPRKRTKKLAKRKRYENSHIAILKRVKGNLMGRISDNNKKEQCHESQNSEPTFGLGLIPERPRIFETQPNDIIFREGRGRHNAGTRMLVLFIKETIEELGSSYKWTSEAKTNTAKTIIENIRNLSTPGRFLRKNEMLDCWLEVDYEEACFKIIDLISVSLKGPKEISLRLFSGAAKAAKSVIKEYKDVPMVGDNIIHYIAERYGLEPQQIENIKNTRDRTNQSNAHELFLESNIQSTYADSKSCANNGSYQTVWKSFRSWLNQCHPDEAQYFSPSSASTIEKCAPWVTQPFAETFVEERTPTKASRGLYISALNFVMKRQHEMALHFLGSYCSQIKLLSRRATVLSINTMFPQKKKSPPKIKSSQQEVPLDDREYYIGDDIVSYIIARYQRTLSTSVIDEVRESGCTPQSTVLESIRRKYISCQSCQKNGNYYRLWMKYKEWLTVFHPSERGFFSPCSGTSLDDCAPWASLELASEFVASLVISERVEIDQKGKTTVAAIYIAGMNFLLKNQYEVALGVLGKYCPHKEILNLNKMRIACADKQDKNWS